MRGNTWRDVGLNEDVIKAFRIGFAPDSGFILRDRLKGEFEEDVLRESGVFSWKAESGRPTLGRQPSAKREDPSDFVRDDKARRSTRPGCRVRESKPEARQPEASSCRHVFQIPQPGDVSHYE